jgi:hypothetical protein
VTKARRQEQGPMHRLRIASFVVKGEKLCSGVLKNKNPNPNPNSVACLMKSELCIFYTKAS